MLNEYLQKFEPQLRNQKYLIPFLTSELLDSNNNKKKQKEIRSTIQSRFCQAFKSIGLTKVYPRTRVRNGKKVTVNENVSSLTTHSTRYAFMLMMIVLGIKKGNVRYKCAEDAHIRPLGY